MFKEASFEEHHLGDSSSMEFTASNISRQTLTQLAHRLSLGKVLEGAYGAGVMTAHYKRAARKTEWTTEQLLAMSAAKSFYN